jgi:NAD(P)-dependent dehydrogenase (short-subunit alcohol dehydrogenase family)
MAGILDRKVAMVTGGASGIGRATALAMAREGARVAVADRTEERAAATVASINAAGGPGDCDRRRRDARRSGGRDGRAHGGRLWADRLRVQQRRRCGKFRRPGRQRLHELSQTSFDAMLATNLTGVFVCMVIFRAS